MEGTLITKNYQQFEVIDDLGKQLHTFDGAAKANKALPGDTVKVESDGKVVLQTRAAHPLLAGYLELNSKTTYGITKRKHPLYLFVPLNTAYPSFVVGSSESDRSCKKVVLVSFHSWDDGLPRGSLERILGNAGELVAEDEALLWSACPYKSLTQGLEVLGDDCPARTVVKGFTFNIDPEGCRDIDDCVTFDQLGEEEWRITITISDVASCVPEMEAVDLMAATLGQTLYRDGEAIRPMLPPFFSEDHCSLKAGTERRGVSLSFRWSRSSSWIGDLKWQETLLHNNETYTYDTVPELQGHLLKGCVSDIAKRSVTDPHEWIEVLMKFYNTEAAKLLRAAGVGILRRHSAPDQERLAKYTAWDAKLGTLAMSAAEYCLADTEDVHHWGIDTGVYCHATSPIRRYADLMNQRILKQLIRNNQEVMVTVLCSDLNKAAKVAKGYERDRQFLKCLLGDGERTLGGRVLDLEPQEDGKCVVRIWVGLWGRTVKTRMRLLEPMADGLAMARVCSADESAEFELREGQELTFDCAMNLAGRRWKDRLIIQIKSNR
jgi:exoribonuclease R